VSFPPSLFGYFDASVHYGPANARPTSGAIGYLVEDGTETLLEHSGPVTAFVSSSALEFRALLAMVRAVADRFETASSLHLHGDADAVLRAVDPSDPAEPVDSVARRRAAEIRETVAGLSVPEVTYRTVPREHNERAHELARAGHDRG
jgi:ribonuclease HI